MAYATVNMVGPRAEQQKQEKPKKEAIDYILEGLQVAQGITGIAVNYQTIKSKMGENAVAEDKRQGILPVTEQAEMARDFDKVEPTTQGSTLMKYRKGDQVEEVSWLPRKKEAGIRTPTMVDFKKPDGTWAQKAVIPKEGDVFDKKPDAPKPDKSNENAMSLRKEYNSNKVTQDTMLRASYYNQIADTVASGDDSGPADISLVFSFMKMNDPGSTVREGEYATAENSGGVSDKIRNIYNKLQDGQRLTPEQRQAFVKQAENMMASQLKAQEQQDARYSELAARWKIDPKDIIDPTFAQIRQTIQSRTQQETPKQGAGEAFAAPSDSVPTLDLNAIDAELKRRGVKTGASGGW